MTEQSEPGGETETGSADRRAPVWRRLGRAAGAAGGTLGSLVFLATLALIFDLVGYLPPFARLFLVYGLLALPLCRWPKPRVLRGGAVLLGVALINALAPLPQAAEVPLLTFAHLWIWSLGGVATGPHPMSADGWNSPSSRNFHGFHAQRNIRSCASCHQEQSCIACHASAFGTNLAASRGGNPHGPDPRRLKGSVASQRTARMCLKCHHPADSRWR